MPLTDKDRMSLFGNIFVEYLEAGDVVEAIRELQFDDEDLAIRQFQGLMQDIVNELVGLNSWISIDEAELLFKTLLPKYGITNENIWWAFFNQDPTLHMWKKQQPLNALLQDREKLLNGDKKNFDRQMLIQAYIGQFMVGTGEYQFSAMGERREYIFLKEVGHLVQLLAENKIKCSAEELKNNILKVFPGLSRYPHLLSSIDNYFANELASIKGEDIVIDYDIELQPITRIPKEVEMLEIKEILIETDVLPKTLEQKAEAPRVEPKIVSKAVTLKMAPETIVAYLDGFIPQYENLKELKTKAIEELSKIRRAFVNGPKKLRIFSNILKEMVNLYAPRYNYKKKDDPNNMKIGQIYGAVNQLYTAVCNDTAIISEQSDAVTKIQG